MAEPLGAFVARRKDRWSTLEQLLDRQRQKKATLSELTSLDRLYRQASADLAQAQTFYTGTDVHRFLNQLCGRAYSTIYKKRPHRWASLQRFFSTEFPRVVHANLAYTGLAAFLLVLGIILGATTVAINPNGMRLLVDDGLRGFIERGELWTDRALGSLSPSALAVSIFTNNLRVTFLSFALGITAGTGTVLTIIYNGVHVGALIAACAQHGLAADLLTFMCAHGPVELSVICITGGAGLMIGHAIIDGSERPRGEVIRERAREAVAQVLGCAPFLVGIGIVEGFVSPGPLFPWWSKIIVGLTTGTAFWFYLLRRGSLRRS